MKRRLLSKVLILTVSVAVVVWCPKQIQTTTAEFIDTESAVFTSYERQIDWTNVEHLFGTGWLAITTVCIDEGEHRAPDGQKNTARHYMHTTMANHKAYAAKHGYPYVPLTRAFVALNDKDVRYHKLGWVNRLLDNFTWVFYTDCDSLFLDFCVDVGQWPRQAEQQSNNQENINLILTGDKGWAMNSGQFIFRSTEWSHQILQKATLEPRNTHGCVGNDNAAFNWLLWGDCAIARGDFTIWWDDARTCEHMIQRSLHAGNLACAPLNTYVQDISKAKQRGPVFRVHFAGAQRQKQRLIEQYTQESENGSIACDRSKTHIMGRLVLPHQRVPLLSQIKENLECHVMVPAPLDVAPIRSPQSVHTVINSLLQNKSLVEVGTRNGDGAMCFARTALSMSAVEFDEVYCRKLKHRAHSERISLNVQCEDYRLANLDADYVTWWQQKPLTNEGMLRVLKRQHCSGLVRQDLEAIVIFDHSWPNDTRDLQRLHRFFNWRKTVWFNETRVCEHGKDQVMEKKESGFVCDRASGWFTVAKISIKDLPSGSLSVHAPLSWGINRGINAALNSFG